MASENIGSGAGENALPESRLAELLEELRETFETGRYHLTVMRFREFGDIAVVRSSIRVEAICLAARAYVRLAEPGEARQLLKRVGRGDWTNPTLYAHLAMTYLEMRDYQRAREWVEKAVEMKERSAQRAAQPAGAADEG